MTDADAGLSGRALEDYTQMATRNHVHRIQREFAQYLFDEAGQTVTVERFDTDALGEVLHLLSDAGFVVNPDREGYAPTQFVVHPCDFHVFRDGLEIHTRITESASIEYYESEIHADATLDEALGIAIHPTAIVPGLPGDFKKPYRVRDADGVVAIQMLVSP